MPLRAAGSLRRLSASVGPRTTGGGGGEPRLLPLPRVRRGAVPVGPRAGTGSEHADPLAEDARHGTVRAAGVSGGRRSAGAIHRALAGGEHAGRGDRRSGGSPAGGRERTRAAPLREEPAAASRP